MNEIGNLVVGLNQDEELFIGQDIKISFRLRVSGSNGGIPRIGIKIQAPKDLVIWRKNKGHLDEKFVKKISKNIR